MLKGATLGQEALHIVYKIIARGLFELMKKVLPLHKRVEVAQSKGVAKDFTNWIKDQQHYKS